jgi:hypothetical protein
MFPMRMPIQVATIRGSVMLLDPKHEEHLGRLEGQLRCAPAVTADLMAQVIAQACTRFAASGPAAETKVGQLIESGAWTDAALALVQIELPKWKLRRLVHEDDEWFCSLSRHPWLPLGLDELAVANHESLPLAILLAFLQARRAAAESAASPTAVPHVRPVSGYAMCCDNFS